MMRQIVDEALRVLSPLFDKLYAPTGRDSIPPERLLRALVLQVLYTIRSKRLLMEQSNPSRRACVRVSLLWISL